jgi:hypothetical protein
MLLKPISHSDDAFGFFPSTYLKYLFKKIIIIFLKKSTPGGIVIFCVQ